MIKRQKKDGNQRNCYMNFRLNDDQELVSWLALIWPMQLTHSDIQN